MSARELAQVLLRVWGVVLIVQAAASVGSLALQLGSGEFKYAAVPTAVAMMINIAVGITFVLNGDRIGAWLVSDLETSGPPADPRDIYLVALAILGMYFLITGLEQVAGITYTLIAKPKWDETRTFEYLWAQEHQRMASAAVRTIAGAILLFRRAGLANAAAKAWRAIRGQQDES